jgi:hypothetical protein
VGCFGAITGIYMACSLSGSHEGNKKGPFPVFQDCDAILGGFHPARLRM